jgi:hypothetical protein
MIQRCLEGEMLITAWLGHYRRGNGGTVRQRRTGFFGLLSCVDDFTENSNFRKQVSNHGSPLSGLVDTTAPI